MRHHMLLLRPRQGDTKPRWRGTGVCMKPGGLTYVAHEQQWHWTWEWPRGKMAWFLWNWRPEVFGDISFWRVGPLTVRRYDH